MPTKEKVTERPSDIAMFALAVSDALARAWGEDDPEVHRVFNILKTHSELLASTKALSAIVDSILNAGVCPNDDELDKALLSAIHAIRKAEVK